MTQLWTCDHSQLFTIIASHSDTDAEHCHAGPQPACHEKLLVFAQGRLDTAIGGAGDRTRNLPVARQPVFISITDPYVSHNTWNHWSHSGHTRAVYAHYKSWQSHGRVNRIELYSSCISDRTGSTKNNDIVTTHTALCVLRNLRKPPSSQRCPPTILWWIVFPRSKRESGTFSTITLRQSGTLCNIQQNCDLLNAEHKRILCVESGACYLR